MKHSFLSKAGSSLVGAGFPAITLLGSAVSPGRRASLPAAGSADCPVVLMFCHRL